MKDRDVSGHDRESSGEFNPTAAYLWFLSQQQQHQSAATAGVHNLADGVGDWPRERNRERSSLGARDSDKSVPAVATTNGTVHNTNNNGDRSGQLDFGTGRSKQLLNSINSLRSSNNLNHHSGRDREPSADFNPTAYLWLLSQQQHQSAAAAAALNLSGGGADRERDRTRDRPSSGIRDSRERDSDKSVPCNSVNSDINHIRSSNGDRSDQLDNRTGGNKQHINNNNNHGSSSNVNDHKIRAGTIDDTTDDEEDLDDVESRTSSRSDNNPVSTTGFNGK